MVAFALSLFHDVMSSALEDNVEVSGRVFE